MTRAKQRVTVDAHMPPALYELIKGFEAGAGDLFDELTRRADDFDRWSVRKRGENDWIMVLKKFNDAGEPVVAFGMGYDFFSALLGLEASVRSGKFRPDKPWNG